MSTEEKTSVVQEALDRLRGLQDVLHNKHEIEAQIEALPKALATKSELLSRLKRTYLERNEEQDNTKVRINTLRDQALESERVREGYEGQMDQIRTQREYEALDKEIRESSAQEMDYRRALQEEEEKLERMNEELQGEAELIGQEEEAVREEESRIKVEMANRDEQLAALLEEEKEIAGGLDGELLFKFERIVRSTAGYGIVPLQGQVCTGCHMTLPAHFVNRVRRAEDVLFCTHGRIVFYQEAPPEDENDSQIDVFDDEPGFFADDDEVDEPDVGEDETLYLADEERGGDSNSPADGG